MTIKEASYISTQKVYMTSAGDNLHKICYRIYEDCDERLLRALTLVNRRFDWCDVAPGDKIIYYPKQIMIQIV